MTAIEYWMEEMSSIDSEIAKARTRFRLQLAKAEKLAKDLEDPGKQDEIANTPPHLIGNR